MTKRPGFVSATGIVVAVVLLWASWRWTVVSGPRCSAPEPLNADAPAAAGRWAASPATRSSADDCGACHPAPWSSQTMADRCLDCHTGVGAADHGRQGTARPSRRDAVVAHLPRLPPRAQRTARRAHRPRRGDLPPRPAPASRCAVTSETATGASVHLRRLPPQGLRDVRPGHLRRLPRRHRRRVHEPARGRLRQGLPAVPRRQRPRRRGLRPQQDRPSS